MARGMRHARNGDRRLEAAELRSRNGARRALISVQRRAVLAANSRLRNERLEHRRTEAQLRASEAFNRLIVDSSRDCIKVLDLDAHIEFLSEGGMKTLEVCDFGPLRGVCWFDFWEGEDKQAAMAAFVAAKNGGVGEFTGFFPTTRTRTPKWWNVVVSPILASGGDISKILAISRDVTDRVRAARELCASEQRYKTVAEELDVILHGVTDGITVLDAQGTFVFANDVGADLCGFASAEELIEASTAEVMGSLDIMDEQGNPLPHDQLPERRALAGDRDRPESLIRLRSRRTGVVRWAIVSASPITDETGSVKYVISIYRDFTERKIAEDSVKLLADAGVMLASSLDYATTVRSIAQVVASSLADWCFIAVKDPVSAAPRFVAVSHKDPAKTRWAEERQRGSPSEQEAPAGVARVIRTGASELHPQASAGVLASDAGDPIHGGLLEELGVQSAMIVPLKARGSVFGAILLISAESGRRYIGADLRVAEDLAVRAASAMENALFYKNAQDAVRIRDEFLCIASHELKTPITSLKLQMQITRRKLERARAEGRDPDQLWKVFDISSRQVDRLAVLVEDMLDVSRIQAGSLPLSPEQVDLSELVREVCDQFEAQLRAARCPLRLEIHAGVVGIWDRSRIEQVVVNLISNAIKYAPGKPIEVLVTRRGESARLVVKDSGPGIPADKQAIIFERFERATPSSSVSGLGLGLFIVRRIVEAHGGQVHVESSEGTGASFMVDLPLA